MKHLLLAFLVTGTAWAAPAVSCGMHIAMENETITITVDRRERPGRAPRYTYEWQGETLEARVGEFTVRPGLRAVVERLVREEAQEIPAAYNVAERQIIQALISSSGPIDPSLDAESAAIMRDMQDYGMDLTKVRAATTYELEPTLFGETVIVVARDGRGRELGKFITIFGRCR